jgi:hypothetical protein
MATQGEGDGQEAREVAGSAASDIDKAADRTRPVRRRAQGPGSTGSPPSPVAALSTPPGSR